MKCNRQLGLYRSIIYVRFFRVIDEQIWTGDGSYVTEKATVFEKLIFLFLAARSALLTSSSAGKDSCCEEKKTCTERPWKEV